MAALPRCCTPLTRQTRHAPPSFLSSAAGTAMPHAPAAICSALITGCLSPCYTPLRYFFLLQCGALFIMPRAAARRECAVH